MRCGCCLLLVASLFPFITAPVPAHQSTEQPIHKPTVLEFFSIENRKWRVAKYRADDGQQTDKDGLIDAVRTAVITFQSGGVTGYVMCGSLTGFYKLSGRRLEVDTGFSLFGLCPREWLSESDAVVKAFKGELTIQKAGDEILLLGKDGTARVRLVPFGLPPSGPTK
jgi:heat shock protein HslJ